MGVGLWPETDDALIPASVWDANGIKGAQPDVAYQRDPIGWIVDVLGVPEETIRWALSPEYEQHTWDGTPDPLVVVAEALAAWKNVGVESATGTGKSFFAACLVLWFLACWQGARVGTYAPKEDQLRLYIWMEIGKLWPRFQARFPTALLSDLRIRMNGTDDWAAHGYSVALRADETSATRAQGVHAEHMLLITEETPGVDAAIMTALGNTCTAPHNLRLALGNPDNQLDTLHLFCVKPSVVHVRISAFDHPNVVTGRDIVPGAASRVGIQNIEEAHEPGTPMWESRVRGLSPAQAVDALIRYEWLEAAALRYDALEKAGKLPKGPRAKGVDVANSENGDKAAIADWIGNTCPGVRSFQCPDANVLGRDLVGEIQRDGVNPVHVGVDPIGVGAGTVNEAARLQVMVRRLNAAAKPVRSVERAPDGTTYDWAPDANAFDHLRSQMWWQGREDLRNGRIAVKRNPVLFAQLTTPRFKVQGGKTVVESKADIKKRTGTGSPDDADAFIMGNWVRPRAVEETLGRIDKDRHPGWNISEDGKQVTRRKLPHAVDELEDDRRSIPSYRVPRTRD